MAKIKWNWDTFWKVMEFIFTLGLSHIKKHKTEKDEKNTNNTNKTK